MISRFGLKFNNIATRISLPGVTKMAQASPIMRNYMHVPDAQREKLKVGLQDEYDKDDPIITTDRVYKPTYTVEFNRVGETLLYSCEPTKHMTIYMKYPYILYESFIPICAFMWYVNPFNIPWNWNYLNIFAMASLWWPRVWYWAFVKYHPRRMWLLRGGRYIKIESSS